MSHNLLNLLFVKVKVEVKVNAMFDLHSKLSFVIVVFSVKNITK